MENHCILFVLYTRSLEYHLHVRSVNIYISLVICNDKHFVTFFREGVKIFLSHSNSFVDISFDTYMPIFKFLAPANSSANSDKLLFICMAEKVQFKDFGGAQIWQHYRKSSCGKLAECKICKNILKCEGGSTKGLHVHLKSIHHFELLKRKNLAIIETASTEKKATKVSKIDHLVQDNTLSAILARMTACAGLSFSVFITSNDLRKSIMALGHTLPKSVNGIRDQVIKYGSHVIEKIKRDLIFKKAKGGKFSLTLDEWTSLRNKRYLNINIHGIGYFWNLGLVRIHGSFSAEICYDTISQKLC